MPPKRDLTGQRFERLIVVAEAGRSCGRVTWECRCDCGATVLVPGIALTQAATKSCGCLKRERKTTHGLWPHPLSITYASMIQRCYNPKNKKFSEYGARGIAVCTQWRFGEDDRSGFELFVGDMGPKPTPKHTLDRIDNDGDYEPGNCRWATKVEQSTNQRQRQDARVVTLDGETMTLREACRRRGLDVSTVYKRLKSGKSMDEALTVRRRSPAKAHRTPPLAHL